jgi:hypothetical protein
MSALSYSRLSARFRSLTLSWMQKLTSIQVSRPFSRDLVPALVPVPLTDPRRPFSSAPGAGRKKPRSGFVL